MSDAYEVTNHILTSFIPQLLIAPTMGLILFGFLTRFLRNINNP